MSQNLELKVIFAAVDKFVRPVKHITSTATEAAKAFKENDDRLKDLNRTIGKIDAYKKVEKDAAIAQNTLKGTIEKIKELELSVKAGGDSSKKFSAELERQKEKAAGLEGRIRSLKNSEVDLRTALQQAGVDTKNLANARDHLSSASASAEMNSRRLQRALDAENEKMKRLRAAQADLAKAKERAGNIATTGAAITAGGAALGVPVAKATKDFADFETAMLGVARQMDGARDDAGQVTKTYWEMADAIQGMSERLPGTANDIAKIVEGGARMGIQGKENLLIYAETTAVMAKAFDLPVDQIGEDIGKLSQLYKVPINDIRQLGDTINWLDDQALAKGGDIIDVMKRIAGTADMVNMSFREAAALGSTFLSLGATNEVAASASNAMIRELSIATMQSKRFQGGMAMLGLSSKDVQAGMSKDATGTIIRVLEKIKALAGDKQLEAATRIFGKEFGDDAAKLASNLEEYRRQLQLVKDQKAFGSMQREADAWGDTLNARIENAQNAFGNLSSDLGKHLKPAAAEAMEMTLGVVQAVRDWSAENPALSSALMTTIKWIAGIVSVLGLGTIAIGAILVPLAALKFSLAALGVSGAIASLGIAPLIIAGAKLALVFGLAYAAGSAINLGINALVSKLAGYETSLGGFIFDVKERFKNASWEEIGAWMIKGIEAGLNSMTFGLFSKLKNLSIEMIGVVKETLGIRSPSRVFAQLGMHTMEGFEQGIEGKASGPISAMGAVSKRLIGIGAGVAIAGSPMAAGAGNAMAGGNTYQIIIQGGGDSAQSIAAEVARQIEIIESRKAARGRSSLRDKE